MSDHDENGTLLPFPRVVLPGSMDAGDSTGPSGLEAGAADGGGQDSAARFHDGGQGAAGIGTMPLPVVPGLPALVPPLQLTVPGTPDPGAEADDVLGAEGALVLPSPEDPANPTAREAAALAVALVTALGVAAAQGMWHRARHRQAVADQARAFADRTAARTRSADAGDGAGGSGRRSRAGSGRSPGGSEAGSSLLTPGGSRDRRRKKNRRGRGADHETARDGREGRDRSERRSRRDKSRKRPRDRDRGRDRGRGRGRDRAEDRRGPGEGGERRRRGMWRRTRDRVRAKRDKRRRRTTPDVSASRKARPAKGPAMEPDRTAPALEPGRRRGWRRRVLFWRARKDSTRGKKEPKERRRWRRPRKPEGEPKTRSRRGERSGTRWVWTRWTHGSWWFKQWRSHRARNGEQEPVQDAEGGHTGQDHRDPRDSRDSQGGPERGGRRGWDRRTSGFQPPPGFEWMRPPPGSEPTVWTVERVDTPHRPADHPSDPMPALSVPQPALTAGTPADVSPPPPGLEIPPLVPRQEGPPVNTPVNMPARTSTQYGDAELTIGDVIDADADMAAQIVDGVAEARAAADGCERLMSRLEALHAKVVELRVPGVLEGMVVLLMEGAMSVKAKAEAIAEQLPAAAEAIAVAGANAEMRHKPLADAVRDAGHTRPAERDYHNE